MHTRTHTHTHMRALADYVATPTSTAQPTFHHGVQNRNSATAWALSNAMENGTEGSPSELMLLPKEISPTESKVKRKKMDWAAQHTLHSARSHTRTHGAHHAHQVLTQHPHKRCVQLVSTHTHVGSFVTSTYMHPHRRTCKSMISPVEAALSSS